MSSYAPNRFRSSPGGVRAGALALLGAVAAGALVVSGHARPADWARWPQQPEPLAPLRGWRFATAWQLDAPAVLLVAVLAVGYLCATRRVGAPGSPISSPGGDLVRPHDRVPLARSATRVGLRVRAHRVRAR